jgi:hypothetical protein
MSVRKQALWMVGYTALALLWWVPYFHAYFLDPLVGPNTAMPYPLAVYLLLLDILWIPASVLLAGALFGGRRGALVTTLYTGIIAALVAIPELFLGSATPGNSGLAYGVAFCTWPMAALVTGLLYQRRRFRGFGSAYAIMLLGVCILAVGVALCLVILGPAAAAEDDVAAYDAIVLGCTPIVTCLLALPLAVIEVLLQHSIARARRRLPQLW